jgi:hypothetical protein
VTGQEATPSLFLGITFRDQVRARMTDHEEDISIVDDETKAYLDKQFESIRDRMDRALQRIGGRSNAVYKRP